MKIVLGITGASGTVTAKRAIEYLSSRHELFVVASDCGAVEFKNECGVALYDFLRRKRTVTRLNNNDASASALNAINAADCTIILPCSTSTVGRIATGSGNTLLTRAADTALRMRKKLILGVCEAPLSTITLRNLEALSLCGAMIFPLVPSFDPNVQSLDETHDPILGRLFRSAGIENDR